MSMKKYDYLYRASSPEDFKEKEELFTTGVMIFDTSGVWFILHITAEESLVLMRDYGMTLKLDVNCIETQ